MNQVQWLSTELRITYNKIGQATVVTNVELYINGNFINITAQVKDELNKMLN